MSQKLLETVISNLKHTIARSAVKSLKPQEAAECKSRIEMLFDYNMSGGKHQRSRLALNTFLALSPKSTTDDIQSATRVAATLELLQSYFLILDDIMDAGKMRRGKPCWYTLPEVGLSAINDACLLDSGIQQVIHEAIPQHPQKYAIIRTLNEAKFKTSIGQHLDAVSKTIEHSTWGRYEQIVEHKTSHYSFYCPIRIGFLLADELDHSLECQKLAYKIGSLFQAQDDYLDIFGQPEITGKIGQDIANGKCTWFSCRTLEKISKDLPKLKLFVECFGQPDERQIDQIKKIMEEASIEDDFHQWSNKTVHELHAEIDHFGKKGIRQVFHSLVEALTGRRA